MKSFSAIIIMACLAYQAASLPIASTHAAEKREEGVTEGTEGTDSGYIYWHKRGEGYAERTEGTEGTDSGYIYWDKRSEETTEGTEGTDSGYIYWD